MRFLTAALLTAAAAAALTAAPVPAMPKKPPLPAAGAVAPRLVVLPPAKDGKVKLPPAAGTAETGVLAIQAAPGGGRVIVQAVQKAADKESDLTDLKDVTATTAGGAKLTAEQVAKRLADGGVVAVSANGKPVDPAFLARLDADTLVLVPPAPVAENLNLTLPVPANPPALPLVAPVAPPPAAPPVVK